MSVVGDGRGGPLSLTDWSIPCVWRQSLLSSVLAQLGVRYWINFKVSTVKKGDNVSCSPDLSICFDSFWAVISPTADAHIPGEPSPPVCCNGQRDSSGVLNLRSLSLQNVHLLVGNSLKFLLLTLLMSPLRQVSSARFLWALQPWSSLWSLPCSKPFVFLP